MIVCSPALMFEPVSVTPGAKDRLENAPRGVGGSNVIIVSGPNRVAAASNVAAAALELGYGPGGLAPTSSPE